LILEVGGAKGRAAARLSASPPCDGAGDPEGLERYGATSARDRVHYTVTLANAGPTTWTTVA